MYYTYYNYVVIKTFRLIFVDNLTYDFRSFSISYLFIFTLSIPSITVTYFNFQQQADIGHVDKGIN
jgi:hypothetical protein